MRVTISKTRLTSNGFVFLSVIFLFLPLFQVAGYNFTFGTAAAFFLIGAALPRVMRKPRALSVLFLAWGWPLVIYAGHVLFQTPYALGLFGFFSSYAIWTISSFIIWMAFQDRAEFCDANWTALLVLVTAFAVLQYLDYHYGTRALTGVIEALGIYNPLTYDKTGIAIAENFRAIGTYYEPSMLGRVVATLGAIVLVTRPRLILVGLCIAGVLFVSRSLSVVVLSLGLFGVLYSKASPRLLLVLAGLVAGYFVFGDYIASRLELSRANSYTSSYIRLVMPWFAVVEVLPSFPFGVPIGANEEVVRNTIARMFPLYENKITNGLYEFVLYFGVPGVGLVCWMLVVIGRSTLRGDRVMALVAFFLLFSTAASSSYLSLESSLLLYLVIGTLRQTRMRQLSAGNAPGRSIAMPGKGNAAPAFRH